MLDNVNMVRGLFGGDKIDFAVRIVASLGVSYYTLQLCGYLLDCYWKVGMVQTNFVKFALFACYFPQMTSGPISRYKKIQENLYEPHPFVYEKVTHGFKRMAWGMFKKMVIADRLGLIVNSVYGNYESYNVVLIWAGIFCFALLVVTSFNQSARGFWFDEVNTSIWSPFLSTYEIVTFLFPNFPPIQVQPSLV